MNTTGRHEGAGETLHAWLRTPLGHRLAAAEQEAASTLLERVHGAVAVQIGHGASLDLLQGTGIARAVHVTPPGQQEGPAGGLRAEAEALPFATSRLAVIILPHVLEFSPEPHQVLREARRVLMPEGHVLITGFNPISFMGLRQLLGSRRRAPWSGRFISLHRLRDWLQLLEFELDGGCSVFYRPPLQRERLQQRLAFLEPMGNRWWPMMAGVYVVTARKREAAMTPLTPSWKSRRSMAPGLARPVARVRSD